MFPISTNKTKKQVGIKMPDSQQVFLQMQEMHKEEIKDPDVIRYKLKSFKVPKKLINAEEK